MRELDTIGIRLSEMQANLFERSLELGCSSEVFYRTYMSLPEVRILDENPSLGTGPDEVEIWEACAKRISKIKRPGKSKLSKGELRWIGYLLRAWSYCREVYSAKLFKANRLHDLRSLYLPYHTLDVQAAIERIEEAKGKNREKDIRAILAKIYL